MFQKLDANCTICGKPFKCDPRFINESICSKCQKLSPKQAAQLTTPKIKDELRGNFDVELNDPGQIKAALDSVGDAFRAHGGAGLMLTEHWEDIKNPQSLANVDENYLLGELFCAYSPISLVKQRTTALREVGIFLNSNSDFTFEKLFTKYRKNAYHVSQIIPTLLPSWRDPFFKRAQLFVGMVYGKFQDMVDLPIDPESLFDLTVFADYRVPQTLINLGLIELGGMLTSEFDNGVFIESGSLKELEIRAATILAADILMEEINRGRKEPINPLHVDYILWGAARKKEDYEDLFIKDMRHHHTMTTDY